jgi:Tfp pilus assembly protein PilP
VRLQAVLSAEDRVALLEVDGEVRRVAVGQAIFEGVKVKTIRDDSITLQTPTGEQRLAVGATWEWKKK